MQVQPMQITIRDLASGYVNNNEEGVLGYGGLLNIRPKYQREFIYKQEQRDAVISSVSKGFPISIMYWCKKTEIDDDGEESISYEVLDGQQRTISICDYIHGNFSCDFVGDGNNRIFPGLDEDTKNNLLDYEITVYVCEGTDAEELDWFRTINIAGEKLTDQELRNAVYTGTWLENAKEYFSRPNCAGKGLGDKYVEAKWDRQGGLERAIEWAAGVVPSDSKAKREDKIAGYMAAHQADEDASELWQNYKKIIEWVERVFPKYDKLMKGLPWGYLYGKYCKKYQAKDAPKLQKEINRLMSDEDITSKKGIYQYVLGEDEKCLSLRKFDEKIKREVWEEQGHKCPMCVAEGIDEEYAFNEMEGDHDTPWSQGGKTVKENCVMLCKVHNAQKSGAAKKKSSK